MNAPARRSERFQPKLELRGSVGGAQCTWEGKGCTRSANTRGEICDLLPEEQPDEDEEDEDERDLQTTMYKKLRVRKGTSIQTYEIGDTVLVSTARKLPSIAVIVAMWETQAVGEEDQEPQKKVRIHWFLRPSELASVRAKRDHGENELYYSVSSVATIFPQFIISRCSVTSAVPKNTQMKSTQAWSVSPSKASSSKSTKRPEKFFCRLAVDAKRGLFYQFSYDNVWDKGTKQDLDELRPESAWAVPISDPNKRGKGKGETEDDDSDEEVEQIGREYTEGLADSDTDDDSDEGELPLRGEEIADDDSEMDVDSESEPDASPRKKRRRGAGPKTPQKRRKTIKTVKATPHSKAALSRRRGRLSASSPTKSPTKKKLTVRASTSITAKPLDLSHLPDDPWIRAMHVLHVGSNPLLMVGKDGEEPGTGPLPCREPEYDRILGSVGDLLEEGSGGCIYISGVPGTGKTATVHAVVRELKRMAKASEINPFTYVEINGLRLSEPSNAYNLLWEAVSGHDAEQDGHMRISSKESLRELTRHFGGGGGQGRGPGGHACVVLMDELDQLVTLKQDVIYNFFNWPTNMDSQLVVIAVANTMDLPERMSGRVRSRLGMTRINFQSYTTIQLEQIVNSRLENAKRTLRDEKHREMSIIAKDGIKFAAMKVSSISGDARRVLDICRRSVEMVHPKNRAAKTEDVKQVIKAMQNSPTAAYIRDCSLHEKIMLASLIKCVKKSGIEEVPWKDIQDQHYNYINSLTSSIDSQRRITLTEMNNVLDSLIASRAMIMEDGTTIARKPLGDRRVVLNIEQGEVERVLCEMGQIWRNIL